MDLTPGDELLYNPDLGHWHESDAARNPLFDFVFETAGPPVPLGEDRAKPGTPFPVELIKLLRGPEVNGVLNVHEQSCKARISKPKKLWPGVVVAEKVRTPRTVEVVIDGEKRE